MFTYRGRASIIIFKIIVEKNIIIDQRGSILEGIYSAQPFSLV
jgi:hypothetical protein